MLQTPEKNVKAVFLLLHGQINCGMMNQTNKREVVVLQEGIVELYSEACLSKLRRKNQIRKRVLIALSLAGLAACAALCFGVNTANAESRKRLVTGLSILIGWVVIYAYIFGYRAAKREIAHGENLAGEPRECVCGTVEDAKQIVRIRNSITARRLKVKSAEGERIVLVRHRSSQCQGSQINQTH